MAFDALGWSPDSRPTGLRIHSYSSNDSKATVLGANYFSDVWGQVRVDDKIECVEADTNTAFTVYVTAVSRDTVTVQSSTDISTFSGETSTAYDVTIGQDADEDIFSGVLRPLLINKIGTGLKNLFGAYSAGGVLGSMFGLIQSSAATTTTKTIYGIVVDNAGTPNFKAAIQANYNGTTAASSLQLLSNDGTDQTALLLEADGAGATRATITVDKLTIALPTYADNAAALLGGLTATDIYKTATGEVRVVV